MTREEIRQIVAEELAAALAAPNAAWQGVNARATDGTETGPLADGVKTFPQRAKDPFAWSWNATAGELTISNIGVTKDGVLTTASNTAIAITGTHYIYATVTADPVTRLIASVAVAAGATLAAAQSTAAEIKAGTIKLPLYKVTLAAGRLKIDKDWIHSGALVGNAAENWLTDADSDATIKRCSLSRDAHDTDEDLPDVLGLYDFKTPTAFSLMNPESVAWPTGGDTDKKELLLVRSVETTGENTVTILRFARHNPMPAGDATKVAIMWDNTKKGWTIVLPVMATNDEQSGDLGAGDRVVVGLKTGTTGLVQPITKPLGTMGGVTATDFENIDVLVPGTEWDTTNHLIQFKKRSVKILKTTAAASNSDQVQFHAFDA